MLRVVLFLLVILNAHASNALPNNIATPVELAQDPIWAALLHYETGYLRSQKSAISDPSFFYSPDGQTDLLAELQATVSAFSENPLEQCRFPARSLFLSKHFSQLVATVCPNYEDYLASINASSMSLIYASGYLGNPASMYGHIFLKFNGEKENDLLDNTFNYGARYPENENPFRYIANGIFGGYQGYFANQKYHHQTLTYNESELRDLWEYELNIQQQDVELILAHLWELEDIPMTYYFFEQNCAYQIARLLEMVTGEKLIAPGKVWVMPYDVIMMFERQEAKNWVRNVKYHGSRQQALYTKYAQLSEQEKGVLVTIIGRQPDEVKESLSNISDVSATRVIDNLYDYYAYLDKKNEGLTAKQIITRKSAMNKRFDLPSGTSHFRAHNNAPPHHAQDTALLQISGLYNEEWGKGVELRFRANYYDLLSVNAARIPFSELSTFDVRALYQTEESSLDLRELTVLRIINLNAATTDLPEDSGYAWKIAAGYREQSITKPEDGSLYMDGFLGKSHAFSPNFALYGALSSTLTGKNNFGGYLAIGPEIGGVLNVSPNYAMSFSLRHQRFVNAPEHERTTFNFEQRFFNDKRFDLRSLLRYDDVFELSMSLSFYY
jgi:hypothetical protein